MPQLTTHRYHNFGFDVVRQQGVQTHNATDGTPLPEPVPVELVVLVFDDPGPLGTQRHEYVFGPDALATLREKLQGGIVVPDITLLRNHRGH